MLWMDQRPLVASIYALTGSVSGVGSAIMEDDPVKNVRNLAIAAQGLAPGYPLLGAVAVTTHEGFQ